MNELLSKIVFFSGAFWDYFRNIVDILIVAYIFYWIYTFLTNTKAVQLIKGVVVIFIVAVLAGLLQLDTLDWLIKNITTSLVITVVILFQPELRRLITRFGQKNWLVADSTTESFQLDELVNAVFAMASEKIGSLIVIERNTGLKSYVESGVAVDSGISEELIRTIFYPLTPLHDGALIIQEGRVAGAACYLPLSDSKQLKKQHGARHRAGLGIAEDTDALVIVTSEERGEISIMVNGRMFSALKNVDLKNIILYFMNPKTAYEEKYSI